MGAGAQAGEDVAEEGWRGVYQGGSQIRQTGSESIAGPIEKASLGLIPIPCAAGDGDRKLTAEEEEARRIAEMGKPVLGENCRLEVIIEESYDFKVIFWSPGFLESCLNLFLGESKGGDQL